MKKTQWIGGYHAVMAAINNPGRKVLRILCSKNSLIQGINISKVIETPKKEIDKKFKEYPNFVHQGIVAEVECLQPPVLKNQIENLNNLIVLDNITDVGNIGSILRSALAFGFDGIIINKRNINLNNPSLYKSSSGSAEQLYIFAVSNLSNALNYLKKKGFWSYCLDVNGDLKLDKIKSFETKKVLILGSEGKGVSKMLKDNSDYKVSISISKKIDSLNVSNAAAVAMSWMKR